MRLPCASGILGCRLGARRSYRRKFAPRPGLSRPSTSLGGGDRRDHRRLGVAIRQIIIAARGVTICLDHDSAVLRDGGGHLPEATHAWTDGALTLPRELFAPLRGEVTLLVHTSRQAMRYPVAAAEAEAGAEAA